MTKVHELKVLTVKIEQDQDKLTVLWHEEGVVDEWPTYSVSRKQLNTVSGEIREKLESFVKHCHEQKGIASCRKQLKEIAQQGYSLYLELFNSADENEEKDLILGLIKDWLKSREAGYRINFSVIGVNIPWGLIYDSNPADLSEEEGVPNIEDYKNFWCFKYCLSTTYRYARPQISTDVSIKRETFHILPAFNGTAYKDALAALPTPDDSLLASFFTGNLEPALSKQDFWTRWEAVAGHHGLIYFYCHADGTTLDFARDDDSELLDVHEIRRRLKRPNRETINFIFFNGCHTAIGGEDISLVASLGQNGFKGFIGTEARVPDVFALRFGLDFLQHFLSGDVCLLDTMDELRKQHFPLSLIFGNYCNSTFFISPRDETFYKARSTTNFSLGNLGSRLHA